MPQQPRFVSRPPRGRTPGAKNEVKEEVKARDDYTCQYCGTTDGKMTIEHVAPVSDRGIDDIANYITACLECNQSRGNTPLGDFLDGEPIDIADLPIHGDIILNTPGLPGPYRAVRRTTYHSLRESGSLTGGSAYKKLEKRFRTKLWETEFGETLARRYPRLPGHARGSVPLVEYLVPDARKPIHGLLIEFTKSAHTRVLIDEMVQIAAAGEGPPNLQHVIEQVVSGVRSESQAKQQRVVQAFDRANIEGLDSDLFSIPTYLQGVPVAPHDLLALTIEDSGPDFQRGYFEGCEIRLKRGAVGTEYLVRIQATHGNYADAIRVDEQHDPPALQ